MKLRTVLIAVVVLVVALVATAAAIILSMDFNQYRPVIASEVEAATGRQLNLAGEIDVAVSLVPTVTVENVSFANADWGSRPEMVTVERLEVEMELLPLITGEIRVKRVVLAGTDILLETDENGRPNWVFAEGEGAETAAPAEATSGPTRLPTVNSVAIENASLTYRDGATGQSHTIALSKLSAEASDATSPIEIALEGALNDQPITLAGSVGAVQNLLADQPFPVDLSGRAGGATFSVEGEVAQPKSGQGMALNLSVQGDSLADLSGLAGASLPPLGPYSMAGRLTDAGGGYRIEGLQAKMGSSDVSGNASIAMTGPRPRIEAALTSAKLDLADFGVAPEADQPGTEAPAATGEGDGRVFPADPLPLEGLKAVDATVKFTAQQVIKAPVTLENVVASLSLDGGKLTVSQLDTGISGGTVAATAVVDASQAAPLVSAKVVTRQVEVGALLHTLGVSEVLSGGKVDSEVNLSGRGGSVREIMASLNGTTNVEMGPGRINNRFAEIVLADLVKLLTFNSTADSSNLNCMVVRFDIEDGHATSSGLVLDTNGATIVGSGAIDLGSEKLDMRFDPRAKETNLVNLAIPVQVRGTLAKPSVTPDPAALAAGIAGAAAGAATGGVFGALAGLAGSGEATSTTPGGENPCAAALASDGGGEAAAPKSTTDEILDGAGEALGGAGDAVKGAGEALKGLFD